MKVKPGYQYEDPDLKTRVEYPEAWELPRQQSLFRVFSPYLIRPGEDGRPYIISKWWWELTQGNKHLTEAVLNWPSAPRAGEGKEYAGEKMGRIFDPFHVQYLFEEIARVNPTEEDSILDFCDQYGLLGEELGRISTRFAGDLWYGIGPYQEHLGYFTHAVRMMQYALNLYKDIKTEDPRLEGEQDDMRKAVTRRHPELDNRLRSADHMTIARARLMTLVNEHLGTVFPALQLGIDGRLYPGHTGLTLLGIAYFQLYEAIAAEVPLRECPYCRSLFVPRTARARFCPAPKGYHRSLCENNYNQMVSRTRKSIKEGKETIEEAAVRLSRPVNEIRSWMENRNRGGSN